jgi:hypothetical protein
MERDILSDSYTLNFFLLLPLRTVLGERGVLSVAVYAVRCAVALSITGVL